MQSILKMLDVDSKTKGVIFYISHNSLNIFLNKNKSLYIFFTLTDR